MKRYVFTSIIIITLVINANAQNEYITYSSNIWSVFNANNEIIPLATIEYKGKKSLQLKDNEIALLKNSDYDNFILEVDMAGAGMAGIGFHSKDLYNFEFIYFRSDASSAESTVQYVPLYNGSNLKVHVFLHFGGALA